MPKDQQKIHTALKAEHQAVGGLVWLFALVIVGFLVAVFTVDPQKIQQSLLRANQKSHLTTIQIEPSPMTLMTNHTGQFKASCADQFGKLLDCPALSWTTTAGSVSDSGSFTADDTRTTGAVTVTCATTCPAGFRGSAIVNVIDPLTASLRVNGKELSELQVKNGEAVTLEWMTTDANSVTFEIQNSLPGHRARPVTPSGKDVITLQGDTTITLRANNVECQDSSCAVEKIVKISILNP